MLLHSPSSVWPTINSTSVPKEWSLSRSSCCLCFVVIDVVCMSNMVWYWWLKFSRWHSRCKRVCCCLSVHSTWPSRNYRPVSSKKCDTKIKRKNPNNRPLPQSLIWTPLAWTLLKDRTLERIVSTVIIVILALASRFRTKPIHWAGSRRCRSSQTKWEHSATLHVTHRISFGHSCEKRFVIWIGVCRW